MHALKTISLSFKAQGLYFIVGKSGCGKSTLLNLLGGLESPTSGIITYNNKEINTKEFRQQTVSYVFQDFNLINDFTLEENIKIVGIEDQKFINDLLLTLGLEEKRHTKVNLLSGGERQRLAIGRAIAKKFDVLLLDEPNNFLF